MNNFDEMLSKYKHANIDIGCGEKKQKGFVGMDYRKFDGVDIVHNVESFPWPIPDNTFNLAMTAHLLEHINPAPPDARFKKLIDLLKIKGLITDKDISAHIGEVEPGPIFMRFMDEVWRILKPGGQFMCVFPHADSYGYRQDPSHVNMINEATLDYFDPYPSHLNGQSSALYAVYHPKPWKILANNWSTTGNMEIVLEKRLEDPSYEKLTY